MLKQIPLIEVELNVSNVARNNSDQRDSWRKRKRLEELDKESNSPEQGHDKGDKRSISDRKSHIISTSQEGERSKLRTGTTFDNRPASKRHKNNSRTLRLRDPKISGRSISDSSAVMKVRKLDPSDSNARVKGSKTSPDKSSQISKGLRRSTRIAKGLNSTDIQSSGSMKNTGSRFRRVHR